MCIPPWPPIAFVPRSPEPRQIGGGSYRQTDRETDRQRERRMDLRWQHETRLCWALFAVLYSPSITASSSLREARLLRRIATASTTAAVLAAAAVPATSSRTSRSTQERRRASRDPSPNGLPSAQKSPQPGHRRCGGLPTNRAAERELVRREECRGREEVVRTDGRRKSGSEQTYAAWSPIPSFVRLLTRAAHRSACPFLLQQSMPQGYGQHHEDKERMEGQQGATREVHLRERRTSAAREAADFLASFRDGQLSRASSGNRSNRRGISSQLQVPCSPSRLSPSRSLVLRMPRMRDNDRASVRAGAPTKCGPAATAQGLCPPPRMTRSWTAPFPSARRCVQETPDAPAGPATPATEASTPATPPARIFLGSFNVENATAAAETALGRTSGCPSASSCSSVDPPVPALEEQFSGWTQRSTGRRREGTHACSALPPASPLESAVAAAAGPVVRAVPVDPAEQIVSPAAEELSPGVAMTSPATVSPLPCAGAAPPTGLLSIAAAETSPPAAIAGPGTAAGASAAGISPAAKTRPDAATSCLLAGDSTARSATAAVPFYAARGQQQEDQGDTSGAATALRLIAAYRTRTWGIPGAPQGPAAQRQQQDEMGPERPPAAAQQIQAPVPAPALPSPSGSSRREGPPALQASCGQVPSMIHEVSNNSSGNEQKALLGQQRKSLRSSVGLILRPRRCCAISSRCPPSSRYQQIQDNLKEVPGFLSPSEETGAPLSARFEVRTKAAVAATTGPATCHLCAAPAGTTTNGMSLPKALRASSSTASGGRKAFSALRCVSPPPGMPVDATAATGAATSQPGAVAAAPRVQQQTETHPSSSRRQVGEVLAARLRDTRDVRACALLRGGSGPSLPETATHTTAAPATAAPPVPAELPGPLREEESGDSGGYRPSETAGNEGRCISSSRTSSCGGASSHTGPLVTAQDSSSKTLRSVAAASQQPHPSSVSLSVQTPLRKEMNRRGTARRRADEGRKAVHIFSRHLMLQQKKRRKGRASMRMAQRQQQQPITPPQKMQQREGKGTVRAYLTAADQAAQTPAKGCRLPLANTHAPGVSKTAVDVRDAKGRDDTGEAGPASEAAIPRDSKEDIFIKPEWYGNLSLGDHTAELMPEGDLLLWTAAAKAAAAARSQGRDSLGLQGASQVMPLGPATSTKGVADTREDPRRSLHHMSPKRVVSGCAELPCPNAAGVIAAADTTEAGALLNRRNPPLSLARDRHGKASPQVQREEQPKATPPVSQMGKQLSPCVGTGQSTRKGNVEHLIRLYKHAAIRQQRFKELKLQV